MKTKYLLGLSILVITMALIAPAMAITSENAIYTSKYVAIDNSVPNVGYLYIGLACQNNIYSKEVIIQQVEPKDPSNPPVFTNPSAVWKEFMDFYTPVGENQTVTLNWAGGYDTPIAPGTYFLTLPDGVGGLPEYRIVKIVKGYSQQVVFTGHVANDLTHDAPTTDSLVITSAIYGADVQETTDGHYETVIDVPAHNEYRYYIEATYKEVCTGSGKHKICHQVVDVPGHWSEWQTTNPHVCGEQTRFVQATYKQVWIDGTTGTTPKYIDVTSIVQGLVKDGKLSIIADYPNQHYNALFTDPCVGTFKHLTVKYTLNGVAGTKTVQENEDLNIP